MLENHMVINPPEPLRPAATCGVCGEQYNSEPRLFKCSHPGCSADLCEWCEDNEKAFRCRDCRKSFCLAHGIKDATNGDILCQSCFENAFYPVVKRQADAYELLEAYERLVTKLETKTATTLERWESGAVDWRTRRELRSIQIDLEVFRTVYLK